MSEETPLDIEDILREYTRNDLVKIVKDLAAAADKADEYEPFDKQWEVHRCLKKTRIVCCGNRAGKSECGARDISWLAMGTHPYIKMRIPLKIWIAGDTFKKLNRVILPKLKLFLKDRQIVSMTKNSDGYVDHMELITGTTIEFKAYSQKDTEWESDDIDVLWADEPPKRNLWVAARRGLVDRNGITLITATPLSEPWMFDEVWEPGLNGHPEIGSFGWSSYDNPHVSKKALKEWEATLTPEEAAVRIHGRFPRLVGKVFSHFKKEAPFVIKDFEWPLTWPYFEGLDPHQSKPHSLLRLGITKNGNLVVFFARKIYGNMIELGEAIKATRPRSPDPLVPPTEPVIPTISDTPISVYDNSVGMTLRDQMEQETGVEVVTADKRKGNHSAGLEIINRLVWATKMDSDKYPKLYIMESCIDLINEMNSLRWDENSDDKTNGSDDFIDPLRYIVIRDPLVMVDEVASASRSFYRSDVPSYATLKNKADEKLGMTKYAGKAFDYDTDDEEDNDDADVGFSIGITYNY